MDLRVTRDGVKPMDKNTSNKNMMPLTYLKEVHQFIGLVKYYHYMWSRISHTLATLIKITPNKVKFKWNKTEQYDFEEIKQIVARDTLLAYPYFNKEFRINTYARNFKLGAVIRQNGTYRFYIRKLTGDQKRYTVPEQ